MPPELCNRLLRRVDWRFLAFKPWPMKSVTFDIEDDILKEAVELISECAVPPDSAVEGSCDLAVASNPDRYTLERISSFLKPGGISYIEWTAGPSFKANSLIRQIEAMGFHDVGLYLLKPDFTQSRPTIWIPLQSNKAIEYTLSGNYIEGGSPGIARKAGAYIRVLLHRIFPGAFLNLPGLIVPNKRLTLCTVASKPETSTPGEASFRKEKCLPHESDRPMHGLPRIIESTLKNLGEPVHNRRTSMLMITRGDTQNKKVGLLIFPDQFSEPSFIVKIPRVEKSFKSLRNEGSVLSVLGSRIEWIPGILFTYDEPGCFALGQTLVSGTRITGRLSHQVFKDLAHNITGWLVEMARKTKIPAPKDYIERRIEQVLSDFTACYGSVIIEEELLQIRKIISRLDLDYTICEHRDLGPWNILVDSNGTPGIIDWENSTLHGFPFSDLMTFFTWTSIYLEETETSFRYRETYRGMLDTATFAGRIFNECTMRYCAGLGISPDSIRALRLLNLLIQAGQEFPQIKNRVEDPFDEADSIEHGCHIQLLREDMLVHPKA